MRRAACAPIGGRQLPELAGASSFARASLDPIRSSMKLVVPFLLAALAFAHVAAGAQATSPATASTGGSAATSPNPGIEVNPTTTTAVARTGTPAEAAPQAQQPIAPPGVEPGPLGSAQGPAALPAPTPAEGPFVLHVEIWPGITSALDPDLAVRDQAQVRAIVGLFARLDEEGKLGELFDQPGGLSDADEAKVVAEEGWILGTGRSFV